MRFFAALALVLVGCGGDSFVDPPPVDLYKAPHDFSIVIDGLFFDLAGEPEDGGVDLSASADDLAHLPTLDLLPSPDQ